MIKIISYSLAPLLVLLVASSLACIAGYLIIQGMDIHLPLSKIISKATQLFLVLSIFPVMAYLKLTKSDLGFAIKTIFLKQILIGLGLGLITLMPIFIILYALGIDVVDQSQVWTVGLVAKKTLLSLLQALLIGVLEESIFRGVLLAALKKNMPIILAVFISSIYFAALHFLGSKIEIPQQELTIFSGFNLLGDAFANLLSLKNASAFLSLLVVGIFLAVLRTQVKESLGLCIGYHAGWVWQIKMNGNVFNTDYNSHYLYLVSSYNYVVGPLVTCWLGLFVIGYFAYKKVKG